jgi:O-antigen/teichoic acid export membrane protein
VDQVLLIAASGEGTAFEEHPVLIVTAAVVVLIVLWQLLSPAGQERRFSPRGLGLWGSARLAAAAISLLAAASERTLLSIAAGACVVALVAWEAWWWRNRRSRPRR